MGWAAWALAAAGILSLVAGEARRMQALRASRARMRSYAGVALQEAGDARHVLATQGFPARIGQIMQVRVGLLEALATDMRR